MVDHSGIVNVSEDQAEETRLDSLARAAILAGDAVSHDRVREWLLKLKSGESGPPPSP